MGKGTITAALGLSLFPFGVILIGLFGMLLLVAILFPGTGSSINSMSSSLAANNMPSGKGTVPLAELVQLAHAAGIPNDELAIAVAIAMAESSGNPNAVDKDSNGTVDEGLWQINSSHGFTGNEFNPTTNAQSMAIVSNGGTNWTPWVTYNTGAYQQYLPEAEQAVAAAGY